MKQGQTAHFLFPEMNSETLFQSKRLSSGGEGIVVAGNVYLKVRQNGSLR